MSHLRVKTKWEQEGPYGSSIERTLYAHHNGGCDCLTYYNEQGEVQVMAFQSWSKGNDLWDAMERLNFPFVSEWWGELKDGVEYYINLPKKK